MYVLVPVFTAKLTHIKTQKIHLSSSFQLKKQVKDIISPTPRQQLTVAIFEEKFENFK